MIVKYNAYLLLCLERGLVKADINFFHVALSAGGEFPLRTSGGRCG